MASQDFAPTGRMSRAESAQPVPHGQPELIGGLPRPLTDKRAALQKRRHAALQSGTSRAWTAYLQCEYQKVLVSIDRRLVYALRRVEEGLSVARLHCPTSGAVVMLSMLFAGESDFEQWCFLEDLRFDEPRTHDQLVSAGRKLLTEDL